MFHCKKRWKKFWKKVYTKCAEKGLLGKDRKIQVKRAQTRSKSFSYRSSKSSRNLWEVSVSNTSIGSISDHISNTYNTYSLCTQIDDENYVPPNNLTFINDDVDNVDPEHFYYGYFPSGWNILDFVIVVSSFLSLFNMGNMTSIRIIRILRPLRTVSRVPSLRVLINTVFSSLGQLSNVLFLILFLFTILGIVGVQLFNGVLHKTCFNRQQTDYYMNITGIPLNQYQYLNENDWYNGMNNTVYIIDHIGIYDYCHKQYTSRGCKAGNDAICLSIAPNPHNELTSFDNIGFAILNEFIMITFDGWSTIMYMMQDAVSGYVWIYFFVVTFVCSFFALQLNLAVLVTQYASNDAKLDKKKPKSKQNKAKKKNKKRRGLSKQPTLINSPGGHNSNKFKYITSVTPFDPKMQPQQLGRYNYGKSDEKIEEEEEEEDVFETEEEEEEEEEEQDQEEKENETEEQQYEDVYVQNIKEENEESADIEEDVIDEEMYTVPGMKCRKSLHDINNNEQSDSIVISDVDIVYPADIVYPTDIELVESTLLGTRPSRSNSQLITKQHPVVKEEKSSAGELGITILNIDEIETQFINMTDYEDDADDADEEPTEIEIVETVEIPSITRQNHIRSSSVPNLMMLSNTNISCTKKTNGFQDIKSHSECTEISRRYSPTYTDDNKKSVFRFGALINNNDQPSSTSPPSAKNKKTKKRKRRLHKFNTIGTVSELHPTEEANTESIEGWKSFKSKTFHASLKSEKWDEIQQLSWDNIDLTKQPSISSFAEMIPSLSPRRQKEITPNNLSNSEEENSNTNTNTKSRSNTPSKLRSSIPGSSRMRFSIVVDHKKECERIMRENYRLSKEAITNARPKRSILYKDTSSRFVQRAYRICTNPWFDAILLVCIIANTMVMAVQWPYMSKELQIRLEWTNNIFTLIFFFEMVIKMVGLGCKTYFADNFNKFDFVIVFVSMIDLIFYLLIGQDGEGFVSSVSALRSLKIMRGLRLMRMFRVLRIFRIVNKIDSLKTLTATLGSVFLDVSYLCLIPFLLVFMFATLGVSLFAVYYADIDETLLMARHSFKNIGWSMITVFQVVTGDNWTGIMYTNAGIIGKPWTTLFFLAIIIFGDFVLMNLFVAVLLTKIAEESRGDNECNQWLLDDLTEKAKSFQDSALKYQQKVLRLCNIAEELRFQKQLINLQNLWLPHYKKNIFPQKWALIGKSLGIFTTKSFVRKRLYTLVHSAWFEWFIAILIIINCIMLACESPTMSQKQPKVANAFKWIDKIFVFIYTLEMLFKIIADGFVSKPIFDSRKWKFKNVYSDEQFNKQWTQICQEYIKSFVQRAEELVTEHGRILNCIQSNTGHTVIHFMSADKKIKHFRMVFYDETADKELKQSSNVHKMASKMAVKSVSNIRDLKNGVNTASTTIAGTDDGDAEEIHLIEIDEYKPILKYIYILRNPLTGEFEEKQYDGVSRIAPHSFSAVIHSPQMSNLRQGAYWADNWNRLDAVVVLISIISLFFPNSIGFFRVLRAVRPLRLAVRFESLRVAISSLIYSIPGVISTVAFILLFWMALAILGVNLMCGTFMRCSITDTKILENIITKRDCENAGGEWINPVFTFDNVFKAIQSIFLIALRVNWSQIMWHAIDSVGIDKQPKTNNNPIFSLYFIITILIAGFFTFNLLISVVVDNFQKMKENQSGGPLFLTKDQKAWIQQRLITDRMDIAKDYEPPETNKFRKMVYNIVQHGQFDIFIMICICLNTVQMCLEHYRQQTMWSSILTYINIVFIGVFTMEAILKIIGYGFKQYWNFDHWNKFDFILVIVSLFDLILIYLLPVFIHGDHDEYHVGFNVLRILRVGRALRLIKKADTLRMMFLTLYYSLPSLFNVGALIFILMFIYSIIGMNLFGTLEHENGINEFVNFATFPNAMQTLYRIGTLDSWNSIYESCARTPVTSIIAALFFLSYCIIGTLVLINVFIAVILENFVQIQELQIRNKKLECVRSWTKIWNKLDIHQRKYLCVEDFLYSIIITPHPIGILSRPNLESLERYNKEYSKQIKCLNHRIANIKQLTKEKQCEKHKLEQKRLSLVCKYCLHRAQDPEKLKNKFLKHVSKIKLNVIKNDLDELEDIYSVSFTDALQAFSAMVVGPEIRAIISDPEIEKPLITWMMQHCDQYLDIYALDEDSIIDPNDDSQIDEGNIEKTPKELTCFKSPHVSCSQYKEFIQRTDK